MTWPGMILAGVIGAIVGAACVFGYVRHVFKDMWR